MIYRTAVRCKPTFQFHRRFKGDIETSNIRTVHGKIECNESGINIIVCGVDLTAWKLAPHSTAPHSTLIITKQYCAAQFIMNIIIKSQLRRLIQCGHPHVECKTGNAKLMTALRTVAMSFVGQ